MLASWHTCRYSPATKALSSGYVHPRCHGTRGAWAKRFWGRLVAYASLISRRRRIVLGLDGTHIPADRGRGRGVHRPGTTGDHLLARAAVPDTDSLTLHSVLTAEGARVAAVLRHLNLLDLATQRRAVTSTVLAGNANLDRALRLDVSMRSARRAATAHSLTKPHTKSTAAR